jgi:hypothetical protein
VLKMRANNLSLDKQERRMPNTLLTPLLVLVQAPWYMRSIKTKELAKLDGSTIAPVVF